VAVTAAAGRLLVVDVGTSGVRSAVVQPDASVTNVHHVRFPADVPAPGLAEFDARRLAELVLATARAALSDGGPVSGVGIANQRATTIVWDRATGEPVAPAIGWQDQRTVVECLTLQGSGFHFAPNASATKLAAILNTADPARGRAGDEWCFGTVDSWVAWTLAGGPAGGLHVTDASNAATTQLIDSADGTLVWDAAALEALGVPPRMLPRIVDSSGTVGEATALDGAPPICGIAGDQQASMVGQGCVRRGRAKATFGTGGTLDLCTGPRTVSPDRPGTPAMTARHDFFVEGTFPIVAFQLGGATTWGVEALMLSAGSCVEWLRDDLRIVTDAAETAELALDAADSDVWFVPALFGLGTPVWDFGARGTLLGLTRGTGRPDIVRAVLEGVAHRGADLLEAAEAATGLTVETLRVDGGMAANPVFVGALAEASGRPVEVSPVLEATTLGAGFLAGIAVGTWADLDDTAAAVSPRPPVEPVGGEAARRTRRERWLQARERAARTVPELSGIAFW